MGLLDQIREKRSRLCHTTTTVTTASGNVYTEEISSDGLQVSALERKPGRCPGFVIDLKPDLNVAEVIPGLCLGSQDVTQETEILLQYRITDIISVGIDVPHLNSLSIKYHFAPILDLPETDLSIVFAEVLPLIHDLLNENRVLFVHCNAGVSRSPSVVIAYLMKFRSMSFNDAFELVKRKRPVVRPNPGFLEQLKSFQIVCGHE